MKFEIGDDIAYEPFDLRQGIIIAKVLDVITIAKDDIEYCLDLRGSGRLQVVRSSDFLNRQSASLLCNIGNVSENQQ